MRLDRLFVQSRAAPVGPPRISGRVGPSAAPRAARTRQIYAARRRSALTRRRGLTRDSVALRAPAAAASANQAQMSDSCDFETARAVEA